MNQPYSTVIDQLIHRVIKRGIRYDLGYLSDFLTPFGHPEKSLPPIIHVAGTNGKGSTVTYLANALMAVGYTVGTYTSPHISEYTERLCLNFSPIPQDLFCRLYKQVFDAPGSDGLSEFEFLTVMSFLYFSQSKPDFIIYETGLGGRMDATNVVTPILSVITRIGLDHQNILGDTVEQIAMEKAGIIKPGIPVITTDAQEKSVHNVISARAIEMTAPCQFIAPLRHIPATYLMQGMYQKENLAISRAVLRYLSGLYDIDLQKAETGFETAVIWGRYLRLDKPGQTIIIDAAHNAPGTQSLIETLDRDFPDTPLTFVIGIIQTKDAEAMLHVLSKRITTLYYCDFEPGFSFPIQKIREYLPDVDCHIYSVGTPIPKGQIVIITGSIYFISMVKYNY